MLELLVLVSSWKYVEEMVQLYKDTVEGSWLLWLATCFLIMRNVKAFRICLP